MSGSRLQTDCMKTLEGKIAIVAGASRGAARGIALALGDAGATVYVAARTSKHGPKPADGVPGTVEETADEVTARGGRGIAITADLSDEAQVAALFQRVDEENGHLDLLASGVWYGNVMEAWGKPFWELDHELWRNMQTTVDSYWLAGRHAARIMSAQRQGLIVSVTDLLPNPEDYYGQMMWDLGHHAIGRLIIGMSHELRKHNVGVVGMNPGFMRTERVLHHMRAAPEKERQQFRFDLSESPEYIGRAIAALAADPDAAKRTGQFLWACDLAKEYGFTDIDGRYIPRFRPDAPPQEYPESWLQL
jgi:NAD(P)-dependent dehydrogenase (short-subunit alcohol dehydrogenase family)